MKLGIFGGTFNPIHKGHIEASLKFYDSVGLDKMLIIPNGIPPHKTKSLAGSAHRFEMARLAYKDSEITNGRCIEVSDIELRTEGKSYTVNTLGALKSMHPCSEFYLFLGSDAYLRVEKWYKSEELLGMCSLVTVRRDSSSVLQLEAAAKSYREKYGCESIIIDYEPSCVSSLDIRNAIKKEYISAGECFVSFTKKYLTESVYRYIIKNNLYLNDDE